MRTVEGEGFSQLMANVEPGYKVPSAMHISSLVRKRHEAAISKLQDVLAVSSSISLTTDLWTSVASEAYITVSGHFISSGCSVVLTTYAFRERHTGVEISRMLVEAGVHNQRRSIQPPILRV